ncbi:uncharacterized protein V6R79_023580 [Siganus canaliculatus]
METKSVTCAECRRLNDTIVTLGKRIESLQQIREDEHFIDSAAASVIQTTGLPNPDVPTLSARCGSTEHPGIDLGDTIPWNFPDNPSAPEGRRTYASVVCDPGPTTLVTTTLSPAQWHRTGDRPKTGAPRTSTPARGKPNRTHIKRQTPVPQEAVTIFRENTSNMPKRQAATLPEAVKNPRKKTIRNTNRQAPAYPPPPLLTLHNRYGPLTTILGDHHTARPDPHPESTMKTRASDKRRNPRRARSDNPKPERARSHNPKPERDTVLIGDKMTKHVRMAKTENICLDNTSIKEHSELLPTILTTRLSTMRIIIHIGSCDILQRKGLDMLCVYQSQDVFISGPIACFRRGIETFSRLLSLNSWLAAACHGLGLRLLTTLTSSGILQIGFIQMDYTQITRVQTAWSKPVSCTANTAC